MPLGDSVTRGWADPDGNGYRRDLWVRWHHGSGLWIDFTGSLRNGTMGDNNHEGHTGWRTDHLSPWVGAYMSAYRPDIVLLHIGTNDVGHRYQLETAPERLADIVRRVRAVRPRAYVFVATIIQFRAPHMQPYVDAYNAGVRQVVADARSVYVRLVPMHIVGRSAGDLADNAHPSACGYAKMAYLWAYYAARSPLAAQGFTVPDRNPWYDPNGPCR